MPKDTIFRPSFGNRPDRIVGRASVLGAFREGLASFVGSRERTTLLLGQRGMGKTALLIEMADEARDLGFMVARVTARATMLDDVLEMLEEELLRDGNLLQHVSGLSAGAVGVTVGVNLANSPQPKGFRMRLARIVHEAERRGRGVLVLLDEVAPNEDMRTIATTYQELVGEGANVAMAMAGLPGAMTGVLNAEGLTFLNRAQRTWLDPLALSEVTSYFGESFGKLGISAPEGIVREAAGATQGLPYLMQLIGHNIVLNASDGLLTHPLLVRSVEASVEDLKRNVFDATLRPLSDGDVAFLRAMSNDNGPSRVADLRERLSTSPGQVQTYRARLLEAGVIDAPCHGEVSFALPYLGDYLAGRI